MKKVLTLLALSATVFLAACGSKSVDYYLDHIGEMEADYNACFEKYDTNEDLMKDKQCNNVVKAAQIHNEKAMQERMDRVLN